MSGVARREALKRLGAAMGAIGTANYGLPSPAMAAFVRELQDGQYQWKFFTAPELATMRVLADLVIPRDERSGPASEAGCIEYADFVCSISGDTTKQAWHDGFAWLDAECGRRFASKRFTDCTEAERTAVLDDIAFPARATEAMRPGAQWFNRVRDLVGGGFFSSAMGVADIRYEGGVFNPEWRGAPDEALRELGVSYAEWEAKYGRQG